MEITGIVIAKNEENDIAGVVESLFSVCSQVIVVDSGSTDETCTNAKRAGAKVVFHEWEGYKGQRRFADTLAETDWILVLDADERLSEGLKEAISRVKRQAPSSEVHAYAFRRNLHFMEKCFRNSSLTCERKIRLYNRNFSKWDGGSVHEALSVTGRIQKIGETIEHYPFENLEDAKNKLCTYAFLKAMDKHKGGKRIGFLGIILHILFTFLKKYVFQCYFLNGTPGLILSWLETDYTAVKYTKLYELNHSLDEKEK